MAMKIQTRLPEPEDLKQEYPMTREMKEKKTVRDGEIQNVFTGCSDKFLVIDGPVFRWTMRTLVQGHVGHSSCQDMNRGSKRQADFDPSSSARISQ
ncbi:MAG: hypothetical protein ACLUUO_15925 [Sellimonas intestinalis]